MAFLWNGVPEGCGGLRPSACSTWVRGNFSETLAMLDARQRRGELSDLEIAEHRIEQPRKTRVDVRSAQS